MKNLWWKMQPRVGKIENLGWNNSLELTNMENLGVQNLQKQKLTKVKNQRRNCSLLQCKKVQLPHQTTEKIENIYSPSTLREKEQSISATLFFGHDWEDIFSLFTFRRGRGIALNLCSDTGSDFFLFWKLVLKIRKKNLKVIQIQLNRWRMQLGFERK